MSVKRWGRYLLAVSLACLGGCGGSPEADDEPAPDAATSSAPARPGSMPTRAEVGLYSAEAPVNRKLTGAETVDPESGRYVEHLVAASREAGGLILGWRQYTTTLFFADADTPRGAVDLPCGGAWELGVERLLDVPIPPWAVATEDVDGRDNPVPPGGCGDEADQDNHMVVIDLAARCEYDLWQARREGGRWVASWANAISLDSNGVYPRGLSSRGSGFAFTGGVIWPEELRAGVIDHALVFSYPSTRAGGPVPPATESDGWSDDPAALPEGAHLRLDPALDLDALDLTPVERTVARALQTYGLYLVDDGGGVQIYAVDPDSVAGDPYAGALPDTDYPILGGIPLDRLQVLTLPPQVSDWRAGLGIADTGCNRFE